MTALAVALLAGCGGHGAAAAPPTSTPPPPAPAATTTTVAAATTTTTLAPLPADPAPTEDQAMAALIAAWAAGRRDEARAVATARAVRTLFTVVDPPGGLDARGCTTDVDPATCTYADLGSGSLYEFTLRTLRGGWYVSSLVVEH